MRAGQVAARMAFVKFLLQAQIELSRPNGYPRPYQTEINGVTLQIQRCDEEDTSRLRLFVYAEVPLESKEIRSRINRAVS